MTTEGPLTRSRLLRNCLCEVAIGVVAVPVILVCNGGWRLFRARLGTIDFWIECGSLGGVILAAAMILAIRDYREGIKKIRKREEEDTWGRRPDERSIELYRNG